MNIANWLYQTALTWPSRDALLVGNRVFCDYATLVHNVSVRAGDLAQRLSVGKGDRVAIFAKNCPEYIELMHACWWLGAIVVPVNCKLHVNEALWIAQDAGAKVIFTDGGNALGNRGAVSEEALHLPTDPDEAILAPVKLCDSDVAWLFYTSGTTGKPKGVMLSHGNLREMALCYTSNVDQAYMTDTVVYAAPISHGAGLYMFAHIRAGGAHLVPESKGFDPDELIDLALSRSDLVMFAAPTMVKRLVLASGNRSHRGEGIRTIVYGGGPMYLNDIEEALEAYGPRFVQIYGQGETPMTISSLSRELLADKSHPNWRQRRASVGTAASSVEIKILNKHGHEMEMGKTGEICVRGPTVMLGYWKNDRATEEAVQDGWLHTGDLGHLTEDGFLTLTDRSKDVIISGGTNIYPREVEEALLLHPGVFEVAVVGEPEADWGEQVVAHVVPTTGSAVSPEELDAWCRSQIASFKKPKTYHFHTDLPKNSYGKILKTELRKR